MILLYHLVFPDTTPKRTWNAGLVMRMAQFKRQILWLKKNYQIQNLENYIALYRENPKRIEGKLAITFDDGYRSVIDLVAPFFIAEQIPATFFCNTRHFEKQDLLWFVYLNALCSEKCYSKISFEGCDYQLGKRRPALETWRMLIKMARESGDPIGFAGDLAKQYPLSPEITRKYEGVTQEQLVMIGQSKVLSLGGHTHNHPYLDQLTLEDQIHEMEVNKQILEDMSQSTVSLFAYTGGFYNHDSLAAVRRVGYDAAFSVNPRNLGEDRMFEIPRTDIYSPSLLKLLLRTSTYSEKLTRKIRGSV